MKESYEERWIEIKKNSTCHVHRHHKLRVRYMNVHEKSRVYWTTYILCLSR